jgi:hypothetical protein
MPSLISRMTANRLKTVAGKYSRVFGKPPSDVPSTFAASKETTPFGATRELPPCRRRTIAGGRVPRLEGGNSLESIEKYFVGQTARDEAETRLVLRDEAKRLLENKIKIMLKTERVSLVLTPLNPLEDYRCSLLWTRS